jgi:hypothetical protein
MARNWPYDDITLGYQPRHGWQDEQATPSQLEALTRRGWEAPYGISRGVAHFVMGLPTLRMRAVLEERGQWHDGLTFTEARERLEEIALVEGWVSR